MTAIFVNCLTVNTEKGVKHTMVFIEMEGNTENNVKMIDSAIRT